MQDLPIPFIVGVVVEQTLDAARAVTAAAFEDGANAVELNLPSLATASREVFQAPGPVYTSCRRRRFMSIYGPAFENLTPLDDQQRMQRQLDALSYGSAGLDIEADTFKESADEWTDDPEALRRQAVVVDEANRCGRSVIYSWHPPRKLSLKEAERSAKAMRDRGADFVKIVERTSGIDEALDSIRICLALHEVLSFSFVFLALGKDASRFRPFMTSFGCAYLLARPRFGMNQIDVQPTISASKAILAIR